MNPVAVTRPEILTLQLTNNPTPTQAKANFLEDDHLNLNLTRWLTDPARRKGCLAY